MAIAMWLYVGLGCLLAVGAVDSDAPLHVDGCGDCLEQHPFARIPEYERELEKAFKPSPEARANANDLNDLLAGFLALAEQNKPEAVQQVVLFVTRMLEERVIDTAFSAICVKLATSFDPTKEELLEGAFPIVCCGEPLPRRLAGAILQYAATEPDNEMSLVPLVDEQIRRIAHGAEPCAALFTYMFDLHPGKALLEMRTLSERLAILAGHITSSGDPPKYVDRTAERHFLEFNRGWNVPAMESAFIDIARNGAWWERLWVAELFRQIPTVRDDDVLNMLRKDECMHVRRRVADTTCWCEPGKPTADPRVQETFTAVASTDELSKDEINELLAVCGGAWEFFVAQWLIAAADAERDLLRQRRLHTLLESVNVPRESLIRGAVPYLCTDGYDAVQHTAHRLLESTYFVDGQLDIEPHIHVLLDIAYRHGDPPVGLVRDLFERFPGPTIVGLARWDQMAQSVAKLLHWDETPPPYTETWGLELAPHIDYKQRFSSLEYLSRHRSWLYRLWVAEFLRHVPKLQQADTWEDGKLYREDIWKNLLQDSCDLVRKSFFHVQWKENLEPETPQEWRIADDELPDMSVTFPKAPYAPLDLAEDLKYTLHSFGESTPASAWDRNGIEYDNLANRVFVGNGMPDLVEFFLLQSVLNDPRLVPVRGHELSHRQMWHAWVVNLTQAQHDLSGVDERIQRVIAAYLTLGNFESQAYAVEAASRYLDMHLEPMNYVNYGARYLCAKDDADNDGFRNYHEWIVACADGPYSHLQRFAEAALDGAPPRGMTRDDTEAIKALFPLK